MTLSLPVEITEKKKDHSLKLFKASEVSLLDLTNLIGTLSLTIYVVLPSRLRTRTVNYISKAVLPHFCKGDSYDEEQVAMKGPTIWNFAMANWI